MVILMSKDYMFFTVDPRTQLKALQQEAVNDNL